MRYTYKQDYLGEKLNDIEYAAINLHGLCTGWAVEPPPETLADMILQASRLREKADLVYHTLCHLENP